MLKVKTGLQFGRLLLGVGLVLGLAGPSFAGVVWSWESDDGTIAYTDDPKRIPAKNRSEARRKNVGKLARYERYTPVSANVDKPYLERLQERRAALRAQAMKAPKSGADVAVVGTHKPAVGVSFGVPATGGRGRAGSGTFVNVPVAGGGHASSDEPTVIESIRVRPNPATSLASRHWTVVKKGDRIVTVIKGELRQRPLDGPRESDFDL